MDDPFDDRSRRIGLVCLMRAHRPRVSTTFARPGRVPIVSVGRKRAAAGSDNGISDERRLSALREDTFDE